VPAKKQAIVIALNMPQGDDSGIREKILEHMPTSDLEDENGLTKLTKFMENHYEKDELASSLEKYEDFYDYKREKNQVVADFIMEFDQKYKRVSKTGNDITITYISIPTSQVSRDHLARETTGADWNEFRAKGYIV